MFVLVFLCGVFLHLKVIINDRYMRCTGMTARLLACRTLENIVTTIRECQQTGPGNFERLYNYNSINFNGKKSSPQLP